MPITSRRTCALALLAGAVLAIASQPEPALAHVKWFCTIVDVSSPPLGLHHVVSVFFVQIGSGFLLLVAAGVYADGWIARVWPRSLSSGAGLRKVEDLLVRGGVGLYCLSLWNRAAVVPWGHAGAILTPELLDRDHLVGTMQIAIAILVLWRRTCPIAALLLALLFGLGIVRYGLFHMTDYVYFLGFVFYLGLSDTTGRWRAARLPVLTGALGFSLMWTAIEKFLYPQWTAQILLLHPDITAGLPVASVIVVAGFVEFSLAFYLVIGRGLLRVAALAFMMVFVSAIPEFGRLDSVGHVPIIATLLAICLRGASPMQNAMWLRGSGPAVNMVAASMLYLVAFSMMTALYYTLQLSGARG
ncbi:hypothetical protein [Lichenicoccus roseus]|uniref:DoxX family membrane protein n=1 Tax=Lichenicoccus roseus TaxID=2683649 RepID=A0A5R9JFX2_9PROT|nr:hypothetical protein [Lichenicoccus roseus]TLU74316.1 hypothetical protein FE263_03755 [Lichenicoccus roseus]